MPKKPRPATPDDPTPADRGPGRFTVKHTSPDGRLRIELEIEPNALVSLAEEFGAIAADMWRDGKLDLGDRPAWLGVRQLSVYLATPINTLLHWRKHGSGPRWHKLGRRVRYARADVDAWVAQRAVGADPRRPRGF